jgi:hypothetical protein
MLVSCSAYSATLKMEATGPSETSADFQWTAGRYIPEHKTLHDVMTVKGKGNGRK